VTTRVCGSCSLCCTVLRVDELRKLGGTPCAHQRVGHPEGGCGIHARRPGVCRTYRCLWLRGGLLEDDRPDRLGAVIDVASRGGAPRVEIREARPGALDRSRRLREIAEHYRASFPVHVSSAEDALDADRPRRILWPGGEEHEVRGDRVTVRRGGAPVAERRLPLPARWLRRLWLGVARRRLRGWRGATPPG